MKPIDSADDSLSCIPFVRDLLHDCFKYGENRMKKEDASSRTSILQSGRDLCIILKNSVWEFAGSRFKEKRSCAKHIQ